MGIDRTRQRVGDSGDLRFPPDERPTVRCLRRALVDVEQAECRHTLRLPLELERLDRLHPSPGAPHAAPPTKWRRSRYVSSPRSTSHAPAACSRRAAVLTGSPVTNRCPVVASPATTSPVLTPMRFSSETP